MHRFYSVLISILLAILLVACGPATPSISLAPTQAIIQRAIALQVEQNQHQLSEQLETTAPDLKIAHLNVQGIEPLMLGHLPTYHIQGRYDLEITLPNQDITQDANEFDLYLQRQPEGKTWRWLKPDYDPVDNPDEGEPPERWRSYRVR
ncbi:MAG: hypothetical protein AAGG51_06150 [Cyanobacteria bacterium P01_G01_bin.54]